MLDNYDDYKTGGTHKVFSISVVGENITITNEKLRTESIVLDEELCSTSRLKFGSCGTSKFTAEIANVFENFEGKLIEVTVTMDGEVTKYGTFKVVSDKPLADRIFRSLTAYDAMNDIIKTNVLSWYKSLTFPMTLKNFRDSFFNYLGITQETTTLVNDNFIIPGGFTASDSLMGGTIITAICELNGVFGHINRDGKFTYIDLTASESFDCPPYENGSVTYEDFVTSPITKVTMRGSASDVGTSVGVDGNEYIIQGNPLIYGTEGKPALTTAMTNLLNKIKTVVFRPFELRKTIGNPCVELGDAIEIETKYETVNSYVLRRTLTGIQALRDRYSALGSKVYPAEATSYQNEISRTKGKMHEFEVTLDGFSSRVTDVESDVEGLDSDLHTNYSTTTEMNSAIEQSAEGIRTEVSQTYVNQTTYNAEVQRLQDEIDGAIESYTGSAVPTLNNYPAEDWTTTTERDKHLGDLYLVNASGGSYAGFYYRFDKSGSTYSWVHIPDNEVQKALADAAEANQKAEAAQATADGIADNLSDNYSTTQQMNSAINQKAGEITQTVSTTYETKSDATSKLNMANTNAQGYATQAKNDANAATDTKLGNYYTKTQTDSAITQKANEITLNVSQNYTTKTEFGNLEIGGRNLLRRTDYSLYNYANGDYNATVPSRISFADDRVTIGYSNEVYTRWYAKNKINRTLPAGTKVTCSVYVYEQSISDGNHRIYCSPITSADGTPSWTNVKIINKDFTGILTWQYTIPDGYTTVYGFVVDFDTRNGTSGQMVLGRVKIELGDKATDWSPAPEDTTSEAQGYANTAQTNAVNTAKSYTDAQLQITSSSILSTVEQGYTSKTEFNNLEIGGRNLLLNTSSKADNINKMRMGNATFVTEDGKNVFKITGNNTAHIFNTTGMWDCLSEKLKANTTYTYSAWIKVEGSGEVNFNFASFGHFNVSNANSTASDKTHEDVESKRIYTPSTFSKGVWTKIFLTFTTNSLDGSTFGVYPVYNTGASTILYIYGFKLEEGNRATDWSPAPEDMSSKSEVQQLANMVAVKVNSSGRLVTAALGVDPDTSTSYVKVKADDIDIIANGNIQLTGKSIGITSTNFSVTAAGILTCTGATVKGDIITDTLKIDNKAYLSIETATATYTSFTLNNNLSTNPYGALSSAVQSNRLLISSGYGLNIPSDVYFGKYVKMNDNALVDKDLQVNGNFLAVGNGCVNGWFRCAGTVYVDQEGSFGGGIELGTKSADSPALIDFHWASTNTDFTARIWQRGENTVDLIGKNSSTWGIWRAASFNSQSSKYVKKNIKDVTEKEAKNILKLRPVKFDYKDSDLTNQRGLIAEEVLEIMPEMVNVPKDYTGFNKDEPWNTPSIDYSKFVPYLIKMIQIQQKEIDDLKK